ncbi:MAG: hypothetical protein C4297_01965 [Gemmataceae bacterium]
MLNSGILFVALPIVVAPEKVPTREEFLDMYRRYAGDLLSVYSCINVESVWTGYFQGSDGRRELHNYRLVYWAKNGRRRLDRFGVYEPPVECHVRVEDGVHFSAWKLVGQPRFKLLNYFQPYIEQTVIIDQARIPSAVFSVQTVPVTWFLRCREVALVGMAREKQGDLELVRVDFKLSATEPPGWASVWFDPAKKWAIVRALLGPWDAEQRKESFNAWWISYEGEHNGVPLVNHMKIHVRKAPSLPDHFEEYLEGKVTRISFEVSDDVFEIQSLGLTQWDVWMLSLPPTRKIVYYCQLAVVLVLVLWIIVRRYRKSRVSAIPGD